VLNRFGHLKTPPAGPFRFIALDVETAGKTIGGICQIGLCFVSNTGAMQSYSVLIDPEEPFEQFNTELHGISADTVAGAGIFPTVYAALFDLLNTHSLVQHSTFDEKALTEELAVLPGWGKPSIQKHIIARRSTGASLWPRESLETLLE
jgi:DNA polymerase-3 subunit epsilon